MKKFFVKALAMLLVCMFVISGINFSIFAIDTKSAGNLGDKLAAMNVELSGKVKMLLYFTDVENVDRYEVDVDGSVRTTYVKDMETSEKGGKTRYLLEVPLVAAQQALKVTITPYAADGTAGKVREYSIRDYYDRAVVQGISEKTQVALQSMLNYGAMAQLRFNYKIETLANEGLYFGSTNPVNNMSVDNMYGIKSEKMDSTDENQLAFTQLNGYLEESVGIRCYLDYTGDYKNLKVTIDGLNCGNDVFCDNDKNSANYGEYYVLIDNVPATKFNHQYKITVTDGTYSANMKCSVLNYIVKLIENSNDSAVRNAAYSMFSYYVKMFEYANPSTEVLGKPMSCEHKRSYVDNRTYRELCSDCGKDISPAGVGGNKGIVDNAADLANGVTSYFGTNNGAGSGTVDSERNNYVVENGNMNLYYPLASDQLVTITNNSGIPYVQNTMDVYVTNANGTYKASNSFKSATANIYRYGHYYYDIHAYGQNFIKDGTSSTPTGTGNVGLNKFSKGNQVTINTNTSSELNCTITNTSDPYVYMNTSTSMTAAKNVLLIRMKVQSTTQIQVRYTTSYSGTNFTDDHMVKFDTIADGEYHDYVVFFEESIAKYKLRLDFNGAKGEEISITSMQYGTVSIDNAPDLLLDRGLHTYTDKMHQVLSLVAPKANVTGITEIGMTTDVTASKIIYKIKGENPVEFESSALSSGAKVSNVEYVGFLTAAGVFGYILPYGDESSTITVEYNGNNSYTITQAIVPANGTIEKQPTIYASSELQDYIANDPTIGTSLNIYNSPTQFYFGQRIYTGTENTFATFEEQAHIERNPLGAENIKINTDKTPDATFDGYDGYRGMYAFTIPENIGFNPGYYYAQNFHGAVSFSVKGDSYNRNMYVMAYSYGCSVEGGAVLDKHDTLLPIQTEVAKNFNHEFEEPIWLWGDVGYSEVRIPVYVNAGETEELTVLQTYMNWGKYPLKQISSIQFFAPYYHLSTGVTESNCIANYYVMGKDLDTLPDHRAASAPFWSDSAGDTTGDGYPDGDPQHDNGGYHLFLQYTDSDGIKNASETVSSVINSSGLTYADIDMKYISDDGKIEVTYTHMEMPQTDENRAYYEMRYKILSDVTINDFANKFSFYSVYGYGDGYAKFGYYGTNGSVCDVSADTAESYVLGSECPYFDLYSTSNTSGTQTADVSFLILDHKANVASGKITDNTNFIVNVANRKASLSFNVDGEVTLKAGDTITIYAIIMPWWNQTYRGGNTSGAADQNVRDVRENTLVAPIVATPGTNAAAVENVFLPTVETTNGRDAALTIGHANVNNVALDSNDKINVTFRVDGFKVLTIPKLQESFDGGNTWTDVEISSINSSDVSGNAHNYDGYAVHYNSDGTYSYSFVTTITGETARTFRVLVDDTYVDWEENHSDLYFGADAIYNAADHGGNLSTSEVLTENGISYVTLTNTVASGDAYTQTFKTFGGSAAKYMVLKYRTSSHSSNIQFFMTTAGGAINGTGDNFSITNGIIDKTGEWKVMVIDLASIVAEKSLTQMVASSVGTYGIANFRLDPFTTSAVNETIDISYIAFTRDLQSAVDMNSDMDISDISYVTGTTKSAPISNTLDEIEAKKDYANMNVVFTGSSLAGIMTDGGYDNDITSATVNGDGTVTVQYGSTGDRYFGFTTSGTATGKYLVMKYKTGSGVTASSNTFWALAVDANSAETGHSKMYGICADGEWHTLVLDLTKLGNGVTAGGDGKYYVTAFRADFFDPLSASGTVDFAFIGLCDELTDIPQEIGADLEYSADSRKNVDSLYVDGDTSNPNKTATSVTGTVIDFTGWTGVAGYGIDGISYVVTDAFGDETKVNLTSTGTDNPSVPNRYFERSDITNAVAGLGAGTLGYVVRFNADLSQWNGQTVKLSIRVTVEGIATVDTYSITVTVPKEEEEGWLNGEELLGALKTSQFSGSLNNDGSVTITSTVANGDEALNLTTLANGITPKYALIKYKTGNHSSQMTVLATTGTNDIGGYVHYTPKVDGEWHTLLMDLTKCTGYNYGDTVSFLRLDICEGAVDYSMTIDHILLCDDLNSVFGEVIDAKYSNNVDYLFVDDNTDKTNGAHNLRGNASIEGTTVTYEGWLGTDGFASTGISYVITDASGEETKVALPESNAATNRYYEADDITTHLVNNSKYSAETKGYKVNFVVDLSEWEGQTVTLSIRETLVGGAIVETYSVEVTVPSKGIFITGEDLVDFVRTDIHDYALNADGSLTVTAKKTSGDGYFNDFSGLVSGVAAPKYAVIKYKTTTEASLVVLATTDSGTIGSYIGSSTRTDGQWRYAIYDLEAVSNNGYTLGEAIKFLRINCCHTIGNTLTVDYMLLCDDIAEVEKWHLNVDHVYVDGNEANDYNSTPNLTGSNIKFVGWAAIDGTSATNVSYVVTEANGNETVLPSEGWNFNRTDITAGAVGTILGADYKASTVGFGATTIADLSAWYGQTVTFSLRATTADGRTIDFYSATVNVPKTAAPGYLTGSELLAGLNTSGFAGTLNGDGSLTITNSVGSTDGTITFNGLMNGSTPRYAIIRYKNTVDSTLYVYAKTTDTDTHDPVRFTLKTDGVWHVGVIDLAAQGKYTPGAAIELLRFDIIESTQDTTFTLDYVWLTDDISQVEYEVYEKLDYASTGRDLNTQIDNQGLIANYSTNLNDDGTVTFIKDTAVNTEAYFTIIPDSSAVTGKYLVVKYRTTAANLKQTTIFASTTNTGATGGDNINLVPMYNDGEWHVMVVDLTQSATVSGTDNIKYVRIDAGYQLAQNETIEYAYIGFCDDLADVDASSTIFGEIEMGTNYRVNLDSSTSGATSVTPNSDISFSATSGSFALSGWLGHTIGANQMIYKVVDGNNVTDWTIINGALRSTSESGVIDAVTTSVGATAEALRFTVSEISLSEYAGKTVTVYVAIANITDDQPTTIQLFYELTVTVPAA
ncbi:MAG: hypothetical protein IKJ07_05560 [Clostridia bacterium]|nr:hypothetical protein [Clostridia bacterium]